MNSEQAWLSSDDHDKTKRKKKWINGKQFKGKDTADQERRQGFPFTQRHLDTIPRSLWKYLASFVTIIWVFLICPCLVIRCRTTIKISVMQSNMVVVGWPDAVFMDLVHWQKTVMEPYIALLNALFKRNIWLLVFELKV